MRIHAVERARARFLHAVRYRRRTYGVKVVFEGTDFALHRRRDVVGAGVACAVECDLRQPRSRVCGVIAHVHRVGRACRARSGLSSVQHEVVVDCVKFFVRAYVIVAAVPGFRKVRYRFGGELVDFYRGRELRFGASFPVAFRAHAERVTARRKIQLGFGKHLLVARDGIGFRFAAG